MTPVVNARIIASAISVCLLATSLAAVGASLANTLGRSFESIGGSSTISTRIGKASISALNRSNKFNPTRILTVLSALEADRISTRSAAESRLYSEVSPGVVLIATKDSLGSGTIIGANGLVLTNLHVVEDNTIVAVVFKPRVEGAEVTKADVHLGTVVRRDQIADLALVQVSDLPKDVRVIALAAMHSISIGSDVHAIGHPTGEAWTYTKGIVSQIRRNYVWSGEDGVRHVATVIQTQTPINPGNSGGPLLTNTGGLVGVNSFKSQGEGLNFAVSVDDVRTFLRAKKDRVGKAPRGAGSNVACVPKSYGVTRLADGSGTTEAFDIDCSGRSDAALVMPDSLAEPARLELDLGHTGKVTGVIFSKSRDGKWDYSIWDATGSGKAELQCVHADGGLTPTRCEKVE